MGVLSFEEFQGYFWLPQKPEVKLPGRCFQSEDDTLRLEVLGTFSGLPLEPDSIDLSRIHGISQKGKPVTLERCFYTNRTISVPGMAVGTIHVNALLHGVVVPAGEAARFQSIAYRAEGFDEWFRLQEIKVEWTADHKAVTISHGATSALTWVLPNGLRITLRTRWTGPMANSHSEARITQKVWAALEYSDPQPLDVLLAAVERFTSLVAFATDQTLPLTDVEVFTANTTASARPQPIQLYFTPDRTKRPNLTKIAPSFVLMSFQDVRDRFDQIAAKWFDGYELFGPSFNLYFATKSGRDLYLENRFLMLAQAIESLHRRSSDDPAFPQTEYGELCDLLRKAVPDKFKKWLNNKLHYGNELSLRQRLKSLLADFEAVFGDKKQRDHLATRMVDTRNYLTHYDPTLKKQSAEAEELYRLCIALEVVLQLRLAMLCGYSLSEALTLAESSELFKRKVAEL